MKVCSPCIWLYFFCLVCVRFLDDPFKWYLYRNFCVETQKLETTIRIQTRKFWPWSRVYRPNRLLDFSSSTLNTFYNLQIIQTGQLNWRANLWLISNEKKNHPQPMLWMETAENVRITWKKRDRERMSEHLKQSAFIAFVAHAPSAPLRLSRCSLSFENEIFGVRVWESFISLHCALSKIQLSFSLSTESARSVSRDTHYFLFCHLPSILRMLNTKY